MGQYFTAENITLVIVVLLMLEKVLQKVAAFTTTTKDDEIVAKIGKAKTWAMQYAPLLWAIVEDLGNTGLFPKAKKAQEFALRIEEEWKKLNPGVPMPDEAKAAAELVAKGLSAADHIASSEKKPENPR